jgi:hypothetical protein
MNRYLLMPRERKGYREDVIPDKQKLACAESKEVIPDKQNLDYAEEGCDT